MSEQRELHIILKPSICTLTPLQDYNFNIHLPIKSTDSEIEFSKLAPLIEKEGLNIKNHQICYQNYPKEDFIYCGIYGEGSPDFKVPILENDSIMLRFRKVANYSTFLTKKLADPNNPKKPTKPRIQKNSKPKKNPKKPTNGKKKKNKDKDGVSKKKQEREIGEAVELVTEWKGLKGKFNEEKNEPYTLDTAALKISVPKKTLDCYQAQIATGLSLKFDFQYWSHTLMGVLFDFVRIFL